MGLLLEERHRLILDRLGQTGRVISGDLAAEIGVSEDTVRRDLRDLAGRGLCHRVYGGALPFSPAVGPVAERKVDQIAAKQRIARRCAELVEPGATVFIDAGTTNAAIAEALPQGLELTVITNAVHVLARLADRTDIRLFSLGGRVDPRSGGGVGGRVVRAIENFNADLCFLGACGVAVDIGITAFDHDEAEVKQAMVDHSRMVVLGVTQDKLDTAAPYAVLGLNAGCTLVLERLPTPAALARLRGTGATVLSAAVGEIS